MAGDLVLPRDLPMLSGLIITTCFRSIRQFFYDVCHASTTPQSNPHLESYITSSQSAEPLQIGNLRLTRVTRITYILTQTLVLRVICRTVPIGPVVLRRPAPRLDESRIKVPSTHSFSNFVLVINIICSFKIHQQQVWSYTC